MTLRYYPMAALSSLVFTDLHADTQLLIVGDTDSEKPTTNLKIGWHYFAKDTGKTYKAVSSTSWADGGGAKTESHIPLLVVDGVLSYT